MKTLRILRAANGYILHVHFQSSQGKNGVYYNCLSAANLMKRIKTELKNWGGECE